MKRSGPSVRTRTSCSMIGSSRRVRAGRRPMLHPMPRPVAVHSTSPDAAPLCHSATPTSSLRYSWYREYRKIDYCVLRVPCVPGRVLVGWATDFPEQQVHKVQVGRAQSRAGTPRHAFRVLRVPCVPVAPAPRRQAATEGPLLFAEEEVPDPTTSAELPQAPAVG